MSNVEIPMPLVPKATSIPRTPPPPGKRTSASPFPKRKIDVTTSENVQNLTIKRSPTLASTSLTCAASQLERRVKKVTFSENVVYLKSPVPKEAQELDFLQDNEDFIATIAMLEQLERELNKETRELCL